MRLRRIILAPDSFKESLASPQVAAAMARGVIRFRADIESIQIPIADGGEGTLACLMSAGPATLIDVGVCGPDHRMLTASFGRFDRDSSIGAGKTVGVIELARASGLPLVRVSDRDPTRTTTRGTGELMLAAIDAGCDELIVCVGGSATVDGGTGIAQACGFRFFDAAGRELTEPMCGGLLARVARIDRPNRPWPRIRVACDVTNPLCGPNGAAEVYGPQKGASPVQVRLLDDGLKHFAAVAGGDPQAIGAGAAGGAAFGLATLFGAELERGIDLVIDVVQLREHCTGADLVITGEGRLDAQSLHGKACMGVARVAQQAGAPTIAIVGSTGDGAERCVGRDGLRSYAALADRFGLDRAMREPEACIEQLTEEVLQSVAEN